ncbi:hypothetical protein ACG94V_19945 [Acinetobacter sp. ULE_I001]|uniref:hypothetical protein n=1 Tax=unclassified Acinetobacter TaxID=196816 RepID=UPI003AF952A9
MNDFKCKLEQYIDDNVYQRNGLFFSNSAIVNIEIDYENIFKYKGFDDALIVYKELFESTKKDGRFLIFTALNGYADEGCWDGVEVKHLTNDIIWDLEIGSINYRFIFNKEKYFNGINEIRNEIMNLDSSIVLEPKNVIYPLDWSES